VADAHRGINRRDQDAAFSRAAATNLKVINYVAAT
jgi:hypothetical protein